MALQLLAQDSNPVMKSIDQDPNLQSQQWVMVPAILGVLVCYP